MSRRRCARTSTDPPTLGAAAAPPSSSSSPHVSSCPSCRRRRRPPLLLCRPSPPCRLRRQKIAGLTYPCVHPVERHTERERKRGKSVSLEETDDGQTGQISVTRVFRIRWTCNRKANNLPSKHHLPACFASCLPKNTRPKRRVIIGITLYKTRKDNEHAS